MFGRLCCCCRRDVVVVALVLGVVAGVIDVIVDVVLLLSVCLPLVFIVMSCVLLECVPDALRIVTRDVRGDSDKWPHTPTSIHTYIHACTHANTHTYMRQTNIAGMHTCIQAYMPTATLTTHTCTHMVTYIRIHPYGPS